jgi:hypothetical protein
MRRKHFILDDILLQAAYYNISKNKFSNNLFIEIYVPEGQLFYDWLWKYDIAYYLDKCPCKLRCSENTTLFGRDKFSSNLFVTTKIFDKF